MYIVQCIDYTVCTIHIRCMLFVKRTVAAIFYKDIVKV